MGNSKQPGVCRADQYDFVPPRTPGSLGRNDAADWNVNACFGDTPSSVGRGDAGDPLACVMPDLRFFMPADFGTNGLPAPNPNVPKLKDSDFEDAAKKYDVEVAAIHAIAKVESGGRSGFDKKGRPKILFEAHFFQRLTGGIYHKDYPELSQPNWKGGQKYYKLDQWERMDKALQLDREAALESASWGMFQVMGENHNGYDDVELFVKAMFASEANHLRACLSFCVDEDLIDALKAKDWAAFAEGYNGPAFAKNKYDEKLRAAYEQYTKAEHKDARAAKTSHH